MFNFRIPGKTGKRLIFFLSFFYFLLLVITSNVNAQNQFQIAIGGIGEERANSIIQTADGGYAAAGTVHSFGALDYGVYIVKLDAGGTLQWSRIVDGTNTDRAFSIIQTTDGGYAVAGYTNSFGAGQNDFYIVKLTSTGTFQWNKTVGGTGDDYASSILQTTDGGYAVSGYTNSFGAGETDFYIVKLSGSGAVQWSRTIGGANSERGNSIIQTTDGGYAVSGSTQSYGAGGEDCCIVKLSNSGSLQWIRTIGGTGNDYAYCMTQTTDGGYAMAGSTESFGAGNRDVYIVKLSSSGTLQWSRSAGGTSYDIAFSIIQTIDGGYATAGTTHSFGAGGEDFCIFKFDAGGTLQWRRTVGGANDEEAFSIIQTADSGYVVAGYTMSFGAGNFDMYIVKLDASGHTCGNTTSPSATSSTGGILGNPTCTVSSPTSIVTTPASLTSGGGILTTICAIGIKRISNEIPDSYKLYQNYPNPFNPATKISFSLPKRSFAKLVIYDILGRAISTLINEQLRPGSYEVEWNGSNYASGIYFYKLITGNFIETKKMVVLK